MPTDPISKEANVQVGVVKEPIRPDNILASLAREAAGSVLLRYATVKETTWKEAGIRECPTFAKGIEKD